jgi:hypothetical protein
MWLVSRSQTWNNHRFASLTAAVVRHISSSTLPVCSRIWQSDFPAAESDIWQYYTLNLGSVGLGKKRTGSSFSSENLQQIGGHAVMRGPCSDEGSIIRWCGDQTMQRSYRMHSPACDADFYMPRTILVRGKPRNWIKPRTWRLFQHLRNTVKQLDWPTDQKHSSIVSTYLMQCC